MSTQTLVMAIGSKPNKKLYADLKGKAAEVCEIGDCHLPRKMIDAISDAYHLAIKI